MLEKVTAFVIRKLASGEELLILQHPTAGFQLPAGTVNPGENPRVAVLREVAEETGLTKYILNCCSIQKTRCWALIKPLCCTPPQYSPGPTPPASTGPAWNPAPG